MSSDLCVSTASCLFDGAWNQAFYSILGYTANPEERHIVDHNLCLLLLKVGDREKSLSKMLNDLKSRESLNWIDYSNMDVVVRQAADSLKLTKVVVGNVFDRYSDVLDNYAPGLGNDFDRERVFIAKDHDFSSSLSHLVAAIHDIRLEMMTTCGIAIIGDLTDICTLTSSLWGIKADNDAGFGCVVHRKGKTKLMLLISDNSQTNTIKLSDAFANMNLAKFAILALCPSDDASKEHVVDVVNHLELIFPETMYANIIFIDPNVIRHKLFNGVDFPSIDDSDKRSITTSICTRVGLNDDDAVFTKTPNQQPITQQNISVKILVIVSVAMILFAYCCQFDEFLTVLRYAVITVSGLGMIFLVISVFFAIVIVIAVRQTFNKFCAVSGFAFKSLIWLSKKSDKFNNKH